MKRKFILRYFVKFVRYDNGIMVMWEKYIFFFLRCMLKSI